MTSDTDEQAAKRRKVRKGTRSCWECRRRKAKCTFAVPHDAICITCRRRGSKCVSQDVIEEDEGSPGGSATSLDQRSTVLDSELHTALRDFTSPYTFSGASVSAQSPTIIPGEASRNQDLLQSQSAMSRPHTVAMNSDRSSAIHHIRPNLVSRSVHSTESKTYEGIRQALLGALPSHADTTILLEKVDRAFMASFQTNYKSCGSPQKQSLDSLLSSTNLLNPDNHPVLLARQMLMLAASLQHFPPHETIHGLTEPRQVIMERLAESAIRLVTTNDSLLGTLEGVQDIVLEGIYHVDAGNIRRAWITMRRAVVAAQLLGLHRPDHRRFKVISNQHELDPKAMWNCIINMERAISLLLGLPTSIGSASVPFKADSTTSEADLTTLVSDATARILERNEIQDAQQALEITRDIDRRLIQTTKQLPSTFWQPPAFAGLDVDSDAGFLEVQRTWSQLCYYTLVNQLHLPYMLHTSHDTQTVYSRMACVNASREILTRAVAIRAFNPHTVCCRMGDFMGLVAGMTLVLAHLVSHCQGQMSNLLALQRSGDRAIVERALEGMKAVSEMCEDVLAARCACLLSHLLAVEADAAQDEGYHLHELSANGDSYNDNENVLIIKVPYIGAVRIARKGITSVSTKKTPPAQDLDEVVTIGGIGSVHVAKTPDGRNDHSSVAPSLQSESTHTAQSTAYTASTTPATLDNLFFQQDQMFPDAVASMDDWVFQGADTAFFDVLMRGADSQINGAGIEGWASSMYT